MEWGGSILMAARLISRRLKRPPPARSTVSTQPLANPVHAAPCTAPIKINPLAVMLEVGEVAGAVVEETVRGHRAHWQMVAAFTVLLSNSISKY